MSIMLLSKLHEVNVTETETLMEEVKNTLLKYVFKYFTKKKAYTYNYFAEYNARKRITPKLQTLARDIIPDCEECFPYEFELPNMMKHILDYVCNQTSCFLNLKRAFIFVDKTSVMFGATLTRYGTFVSILVYVDCRVLRLRRNTN